MAEAPRATISGRHWKRVYDSSPMTESVVPATGDRRGTGSKPVISYLPWGRLWDEFEQKVADLVRTSGASSVGELGGGANPTLTMTGRVGRPIDLTVLDISPTELAQCPPEIETLCVDLCSATPPVRDRFDVIFSRMLCEHVSSGERFHRNCYEALHPGGYAVHFFPAPTALPFALNRVLPSAAGERILEFFFPARKQGGKYGKFPALYHWCWGPTSRQLRRFRSVGFEVVSCDVGVGHGYYEPLPGLRALERAKAELVLRHPSPWLAAYVIFVLRRPPESAEA